MLSEVLGVKMRSILLPIFLISSTPVFAETDHVKSCKKMYGFIHDVVTGGADSYFALKLINGEISMWRGTVSANDPDIFSEAMLATYYIIQAGKLKGEDLKYIWDDDCDAYAN